MMESYEKLGAFYLGRPYDLKTKQMDESLLLYDSKDLVTHAVCVGMTGSGKTGLCIGLLEEAAIDGVPALIVDPKGDLGNLMLTFPDLAAKDFAPWINEDDARRKGQSAEEYAAAQAELWSKGLAKWGQSGERIQRLREAAEVAIYTPGSEAGIPISILSSFAAPSKEVVEDTDLYGDRISSTASSLLGLLGIDADPIRSREHILLSTLFDVLWRQGRDLDLGTLIQAIQNPPVQKVGVMELESFYPSKERFELAMQLNNLLAAPGFSSWLTGEPLDVQQLLYTPEGKPRLAILSIAHLSEAERMFFVSLLLNQTVSWMRSRPGTTSLRALLYMDEIFGYMPPVAEPPSKRPLLTLLKQARAYGLGVVLATQNPMDLDYKGLSNTGTWFIGRLQTERDKKRVLDGLEGISAAGSESLSRKDLEKTINGLGKRVFLLHNVHDDGPEIFHTRWAMSYLRGPLTRKQIQTLMADKKPEPAQAASAPKAAAAGTAIPSRGAATRPVLPPEVEQVFLPVRRRVGEIAYRPALLGLARVHFQDRRKTVEHDEDVALLLALEEHTLSPDWREAQEVDLRSEDLDRQPETEVSSYAATPSSLGDVKKFKKWDKGFAEALYRSRTCDLYKSPSLKVQSEPGESERDFRVRLADLAREERDQRKEALQDKFDTKIARLEERLRKAHQAVEREKDQAKNAKMQSALSVVATLGAALLGRRKLSYSTLSRAGTAARGASRAHQQAQDVDRAEETVEALTAQLEELRVDLEAEIREMEAAVDPRTEELEIKALHPRKTDIDVQLMALCWVPYADGEAAWD